MRLILLLCLFLSGCAVIASVTGASSSTVTAIKTAEAIKLGANAASTATTNKTLEDHALSSVTGKDCKMWNAINHKSICEGVEH
jgi:uncharacterized protein YceK